MYPIDNLFDKPKGVFKDSASCADMIKKSSTKDTNRKPSKRCGLQVLVIKLGKII